VGPCRVHCLTVEGFWPIFFLAVVLKIPVAALLYLVWWAIKQSPETEEAPPEAEDRDLLHWRRKPKPKKPRDPRRGPHAPDAQPLPACPPAGRTRVFAPPVPARAAAARARGASQPAESETV
jgi:hypothetical protein